MLEAKILLASRNDKGLSTNGVNETVEVARAIHWIHELAAFVNNAASSGEDARDQSIAQRTGSITLTNNDWILHVYFHSDFSDNEGMYTEFELFDRASLGKPRVGPNITSGRARITTVSDALQIMNAGESPVDHIAGKLS